MFNSPSYVILTVSPGFTWYNGPQLPLNISYFLNQPTAGEAELVITETGCCGHHIWEEGVLNVDSEIARWYFVDESGEIVNCRLKGI